MSIKYFDIALFPFSAPLDRNSLREYPILNEKIAISDDLSITPINGSLNDQILLNCSLKDKILKCIEPRGCWSKYQNQDGEWGENRPTKLFHIKYAFAREDPPESDQWKWDSDEKLGQLIALSRIIHPTSISYEYSAKLEFNGDKLEKVIPGPTTGLGSQAYVSPIARNWLTEKDAEELKQLFEIYTKRKFCDSCCRARWFFEYAAQTYALEVRCLCIVAGIESLINTDSDRPTKQFVYRIRKLGEELNLGFSLSKKGATDMYALRSKVAHGESIVNSHSENSKLYKQMEDILRLTIRKFIIDENFYNFISDKDKVRSKWALPKIENY